MNEKYTRVKGFADLFSEESAVFTFLEEEARTMFAKYEYTELRTPILEYTALFQRSIGAVTDVVQKEMFTFLDRKGRSLTMRPEATAGVMRAFIEAGKDRDNRIHKFYTIGPMFRFERPQKGRMRQFHQINCECLGSASPYIDAEIIAMLMNWLYSLQLGTLRLKMNSLGCPECRPKYLDALKKFLDSIDETKLCPDCRTRKNINPLRVLDCNEENCKNLISNAPRLIDYNCEDCRKHFDKVLSLLGQNGLDYTVDNNLVRGLDYYCQTTFEVESVNIGSQTAVAGGGRYNGLLRQLGGNDVPGIGFACGMERLALLVPAPQPPRLDFYLACPDAAGMDSAFSLMENLRKNNFAGEMNYDPASFKKLLRIAANKLTKICLILGSMELENETITIKNMDSGTQKTVPINDLINVLRELLP